MRYLAILFGLVLIAGCGAQSGQRNGAQSTATNTAYPGDARDYPADPMSNMVDFPVENATDMQMGNTAGMSASNATSPPPANMTEPGPGNAAGPSPGHPAEPGQIAGQGVTPARRAQFAAYCRRAALDAAACAAFTDRYGVLEQGVGALVAPPSMYRGRRQRVVLSVGEDGAATAVTATAVNQLGPGRAPPVVQTTVVPISGRMRIELRGGNFTIEPQGPIYWEPGVGTRQTWEWYVTPQVSGPQVLVATIQPVAQVDGREVPLADAAERSLQVTVAVTAQERADQTKGFFETTTGLVVAATLLIGALSGLYLAIRRFGKRQPRS